MVPTKEEVLEENELLRRKLTRINELLDEDSLDDDDEDE